MASSDRSPFAARTAARLAATQLLYQEIISGAMPQGAESPAAAIAHWGKRRLSEDESASEPVTPDPALLARILGGVSRQQEDIDSLLRGALDPAWPPERIEAALLAILQAGGYELLAETETPAGVIINDYIEIARAFFSGSEPALVNGVLDKLAKTVRATPSKPREPA